MEAGILTLLLDRAEKFRDRVALSIRENGRFRELTYGELNARARSLSDWLIFHASPRGRRIGIYSEGRPEWAVVFFAAMRAGAVVVPLDPKLSAAELSSLVSDAGIDALFVSPALLRTARQVADAMTKRPDLFVLGEAPAGSGELSITALSGAPPQTAPERHPEEVGVIAYTSGTTGRPRGAMIRYSSLVFEVVSLSELVPVESDDVFLSMLPPSHLLELTGGLVCVLYRGGEVCYGQTLLPREMAEIAAERRVTQFVTVPIFLKLLRAEIERGALAESGSLRRVVVGGAALGLELEDFFEAAGVEVVQGYGLTECSPVVAVNSVSARRRGTVGRPLPGVEVRIDAATGGEGEIWTRGPHVMQGYLGDGEATRAMIDGDGWLHTGDLGRIDADGFLSVTGRLKNVIVLGSGLKVQPEEVEEALAACPDFIEFCVLGVVAREGLCKGFEEVCAVVVPAGDSGGQLAAASAIDRAVASLSPHKRPSRVVLHQGPLPRTASRKVRRPLLAEWLAATGAIS